MSTEYRTASTRALTLTDDGFLNRVGRLSGMELPDGDLHAYVLGAATTVCGLNLDDLRTWPDMPYPILAYPTKCEHCESSTEPAIVNTRWRNRYLAA